MATNPNSTTPEIKKFRHRSPNYPAVGLAEAIERAVRFYGVDQKAGAPLEIALRHMGFSGKHGKSMMVLSALKKFGLVDDVAGRIVPTQRTIELVAFKEGDPRRQKAIRDAALSPDIYRKLWEKYAETGLPPQDDTLASELVAYKGFNQTAVADFVKDFRESLNLAGISAHDGVQSEVEGKPEDAKKGDYVQWESQGVLQFIEPRRVREISDDGLWAFVEGSNTGAPVKELTVVDPPKSAPPAPPAPSALLASIPPRPRTFVEAQETTGIGTVNLPGTPQSDTFTLPEGIVTIQWPATLSAESYQDLGDWLNLVKRKIGRSVSRLQAQKDRIVQAVRRIHSSAVVKFEDRGSYIWFRVVSPDGTVELLPASEDRDVEFYERLSEEGLEERIHALSNNRV